MTARSKHPHPSARWPWELRDDESPRAFAAFATYRDMGPERSLRKLARELNKAVTTLAGFSKAHDWQERVREFDAHEDREALLDRLDRIREMNRRHATVAGSMLSKALQRLRDMDATELTATEVRQFITESAKLERLALGEPGEITRHQGPDGSEIAPALTPPSEEDAAAVIEAMVEAGVLPSWLVTPDGDA